MESKTTDLKDLLSNSQVAEVAGEAEVAEVAGVVEVAEVDTHYSSIELSNEEIDSMIDGISLNEDELNGIETVMLEKVEELKKEPSLFDKEWTKLEKGMKLNRVALFIQREKEENKLSDAQAKSLKAILFKACNDGMLNKACDVTYKDEQIISIRNLEFNEQTKKYKLKTSSSKHRVNVKSRSNIDRFMKKS